MRRTKKDYTDLYWWGFGSSDDVQFYADKKQVVAIGINKRLGYYSLECKEKNSGETIDEFLCDIYEVEEEGEEISHESVFNMWRFS